MDSKQETRNRIRIDSAHLCLLLKWRRPKVGNVGSLYNMRKTLAYVQQGNEDFSPIAASN